MSATDRSEEAPEAQDKVLSAADAGASASAAQSTPGVPELTTKEQLMLKLGKDLRKQHDYAQACHTLAHLLDTSVKARDDEMSIHLAPIFHEYGITLLAKARASSSIFGGAEDAGDAGLEGQASDAAVADAAEEQGQDLVHAHDILDLARAIYEANSSGDSEAAKKNAFRLAQCREDLADCMMESDRMGDAYDELQHALKLHVQLKSPARAQAETLQQMVLCLTYIQSEMGKGGQAGGTEEAAGGAAAAGKLAPETVVLGRALKVQRFAIHALAYAALDILQNVEALRPLVADLQSWIEVAEGCGAAEAPDVDLPQKEQTARSMQVLTAVTQAIRAGKDKPGEGVEGTAVAPGADSAGLTCPLVLESIRDKAEAAGMPLDSDEGEDLVMLLETADASVQRYAELAAALSVEDGDGQTGGKSMSGGAEGGSVSMGGGFQFFGGDSAGGGSNEGVSTFGFGDTGASATGKAVVVHEPKVRKKKRPAKRVAPIPVEAKGGQSDRKAGRTSIEGGEASSKDGDDGAGDK